MRLFGLAVAVIVVTAAPLFAQERGQNGGWQDAAAYVSGLGGFQTATGNTTGDVLVEGGVRVAPHVMVFGDLGWFRSLQNDLDPSLNSTVTSLQTTQGLSVTGSGRLPALYSIGGVRVEIPVSNLFLPYVLGGAGAARLSPTQQFLFASGTMPDGSTPGIGQDVTSSLTTAGALTPPLASTAFMSETQNDKRKTRHAAIASVRVYRLTFYVMCSICPVDADRTTASVTAAPWIIWSSGIGKAGPPLAAWANASRQARVTSSRAASQTVAAPVIG
jgi:hypothetical protein